MKCVKCGTELKEGCIYCSVCGNEAQMVPDYSVLEDDYLRSLLKEEEEQLKHKASREDNSGKKKQETVPKKKTDSRIPVLVVCILLAVCIIIGVVIKLVINHKNSNSYDYQMEMAQQEYIDKNYESALQYYKTALSLKPDDVTVRLAMAEIYIGQEAYDEAIVLLTEVVDMKPEEDFAYEGLIHIYEAKKDYASIIELASDVQNDDILELFDDYLVEAPVISPIAGEYDEFVPVTMFSADGYDIYYTVDGSEPTAETGKFYKEENNADAEGIILEENGRYTIRAVCVNEKGIASEIIEAVYEIELAVPEFAKVYPDGGRVGSETTVTIEAEEDCSIYYTWDGTDPTIESLRYEEPLEIPTGNNILSVLVVNEKTGLDSGVYRTNFIYYP